MGAFSRPGTDGVVDADRTRVPGTYGRFARAYDMLAASERRPTGMGVDLLAPHRGERLLEIGCGPGRANAELAARVAPTGHVDAIDLSAQMVALAEARLGRAGLSTAASVYRADARELPFAGDSFDGVFLSFTLELFPDDEQAHVLGECRRVLRKSGRIVVVSLTSTGHDTTMRRLYVRLHR
ncbi:MAG: methyltransferase domain-containing protein, partial [Actinobacteria bacterium]|nr:methyltransferase domain-containing protein [Actinomycetota bacterium]